MSWSLIAFKSPAESILLRLLSRYRLGVGTGRRKLRGGVRPADPFALTLIRIPPTGLRLWRGGLGWGREVL